jgi:hypothetical protein
VERLVSCTQNCVAGANFDGELVYWVLSWSSEECSRSIGVSRWNLSGLDE